MRMAYECECGREHALEGDIGEELSGYSGEIQCECGAVYAVSVTMLRPPKE